MLSPTQRYFKNMLIFHNIKTCYLSPSLLTFKRIYKIFNLSPYYPQKNNDPCLFFGVYSNRELNIIKKHKGVKFIMFGGSDCDNRLSHRNGMNVLIHLTSLLCSLEKSKFKYISISKNIHERLGEANISSSLFTLDLVNYKLFKPVKKLGKSIYIYDGCSKHPRNILIYSTPLIKKIKSKLPQFNYIHSSDNWVNYEKTSEIYKKCFIGIRLTLQDGNANTVQEFKAMNIPIVHNLSEYGLKWNTIDDILKHIEYCNENYKNKEYIKDKKDYYTADDFNTFNIVKHNIQGNNGDQINEMNFVERLKQKNKNIYLNDKFYHGENNPPEITIIRDSNGKSKFKNIYRHIIPYNKKALGNYFITKSLYECLKEKHHLLVSHVFSEKEYNEIIKKPAIVTDQIVYKQNYNWLSNDDIETLKLKYFKKNTFVLCISGRVAMNCYPHALISAITKLRHEKYDIELLILGNIVCNPWRLTPKQFKEIKKISWIKNFTVKKKDVLNYYRICDMLTFTYNDFCTVVGGSNKMKEYLLCNIPILSPRGRERERELGKNYPGLYDCKSCYTVPPLCWTKEYINNPQVYINQFNKYLSPHIQSNDFVLEVKKIIEIIKYQYHVIEG